MKWTAEMAAEVVKACAEDRVPNLPRPVAERHLAAELASEMAFDLLVSRGAYGGARFASHTYSLTMADGEEGQFPMSGDPLWVAIGQALDRGLADQRVLTEVAELSVACQAYRDLQAQGAETTAMTSSCALVGYVVGPDGVDFADD